MPAKAAQRRQAPRAPEPPTGTVAFLFTDIEGSTRLARGLPDAYESLLERHRSILREAFLRHDGFEVGTEGDSFFVAFGSPLHALGAAAEAQRALTAAACASGSWRRRGRISHARRACWLRPRQSARWQRP